MSQSTRVAREAPADAGLTAFYREMTSSERRTFWACFSGWVLDGMDFMIYPLVIGSIIALWQVDRGTAGLAVTVTLLFSAVGGWLAGYVADRIGRVRTLQLTILWFSVFSLICAFTQSFGQLMVCRALLGLGFGGEWAAGAVLIGEAIRPQFRGRAVGSVQSGWAVGWGGAVMMQAVLFTVVPPGVAWRWMFALGALPALLVFFLRRYVEEPEVAVETRARLAATGEQPGLWEIFAPGLRRTTLLAALLGTGAQGGYYAISTWVPTFLRSERGLTVIGSSGYLAVLITGSFVGYLLGAWLADRIGRRPLFILSSIAAIALVLVYTTLPFSNTVMLWLGFPLGVASSAYFSGMGAFFTEIFPTRLRGSGQGFAYNFGRGIGALFPTLVGYLSGTVALSTAIAVFAVIAYGLLLLAALLLPETRGKVLQANG
ncbi:MAG: MFS transporter [Janthinobacterium lividum]